MLTRDHLGLLPLRMKESILSHTLTLLVSFHLPNPMKAKGESKEFWALPGIPYAMEVASPGLGVSSGTHIFSETFEPRCRS